MRSPSKRRPISWFVAQFLVRPSCVERRKCVDGELSIKMAEREGFEPSIRYNRIPDFESGAFDHSATFPTD